MNADIEKILSAAIQAPSGENCQPWRFVVDGMTIEQWNRPERDQSANNWGQRRSYLSNGAALENLVIAANSLGYDASIRYFPDEPDHVATISLAKNGPAKDPLNAAIFERASNRNPYRVERLTGHATQELIASSKKIGYGNVQITDNPIQIARLAAVGGVNEEVVLSNDTLHSFFFHHLNWTKEEDSAKKSGVFIESLELPLFARLAFRLLKQPWAIRLLRKAEFPKIVGEQNAARYRSSCAILAIKGEGFEPIDFVKAGRVLERAWLQATQSGLSMQPIGGVLFFMLGVRAGDTHLFSKQEIFAINEAYSDVQRAYGTDAPILFLARIGRADPPSVRSRRFSVEECVEVRESAT